MFFIRFVGLDYWRKKNIGYISSASNNNINTSITCSLIRLDLPSCRWNNNNFVICKIVDVLYSIDIENLWQMALQWLLTYSFHNPRHQLLIFSASKSQSSRRRNKLKVLYRNVTPAGPCSWENCPFPIFNKLKLFMSTWLNFQYRLKKHDIRRRLCQLTNKGDEIQTEK